MSSDDKSSVKKNPFVRNLLLFVLLWAVLLYVFGTYDGPSEYHKMPYSDFKSYVREGKVSEITVRGDRIQGLLKEPNSVITPQGSSTFSQFETVLPPFENSELMPLLEKNNVTVKAKSNEASWLATMFLYLIPWVLIIGFFVYSGKRLQGRVGSGGGLFGFGKSKARLYDKSTSKVTFKDVAGLNNAKKEFSEIIDYLKDPSKYRALGAKLPKGILLAGPPGTGKTLMARATAGEADVPFYSISGSEFVEMFVGVGASRVRDMFENAKKDAPAIIFIDELDSIGRIRGAGLGGGHDEREQTLNQILAEMDGFSPHQSVIVMAATNRPDVLDPALIRPGRFDRQITLELPQKNARKEILELHAQVVPLANDIDFESLAKRTIGFSGAELMNLVNEAALLAARHGKKKVGAEDFDRGMDKIIMGIEREDLINDEEKEAIAYHEAGHALMAKLLPGADPLKKVSIIPRGRSLGATETLPDEDRHNLGRKYLLDRIAIMLGGRVAEKMVYNDITTGIVVLEALTHVNRTELARRMVCQWGMSTTLGPVTFSRGDVHPFLGRELGEPRDFSEDTARLIDDEIRGILNESEAKCEKLLGVHRDKLDALAQGLLDHESLLNDEVDQILASPATLLRPRPAKPAESGRRTVHLV